MAAEGAGAVPIGEPPHDPMEGAASTAAPPESEKVSPMAIAPEDGSDSEHSSELDDWEWIRQHDFFSTALHMPPRDSAQPDEWRARREALKRKIIEWEASPDGIAVNAEVDAALARSYQAHEALERSGAVGQLEFDERTALMFKVENGGAVASGRLPVAQTFTKEMLWFAWKAIESWCTKALVRELSASYGNFDKLVALGWLLGDVIGGRLIDGKIAHGIGRRLGKYASGLKAEFDAPLRRIGKRKFADNQARERERAAAAAEEADLRREEVEFLEEEAAALAPPAPPAAASAADTVCVVIGGGCFGICAVNHGWRKLVVPYMQPHDTTMLPRAGSASAR